MTESADNGKRSHWRLTVQLPPDYADQAPAIFGWLRDALIPAVLSAPVPVTLAFEPPEPSERDVRSPGDTQ